jgi:hypothetical protein
MEIQAFGYLGVGSSNLDDWAAFATSNIGMQSVPDRTEWKNWVAAQTGK